jgi:hypothetical protein
MRYFVPSKLTVLAGLLTLLWGGAALALPISGATAKPSPFSRVDVSGGQEQVSLRLPIHETDPALVGQRNTDYVLAACRQSDPTPSCSECRHTNLVAMVAPRSGATENLSSNQLRSFGVWGFACSQLSLQILFCTWQA